MADHVLEINDVAKRFGATLALDDISLHLDQGEILALLGDNGAGKSTLIKILSGVVAPDAGEIRIDGEEVRDRVAPPRPGARHRDRLPGPRPV